MRTAATSVLEVCARVGVHGVCIRGVYTGYVHVFTSVYCRYLRFYTVFTPLYTVLHRYYTVIHRYTPLTPLPHRFHCFTLFHSGSVLLSLAVHYICVLRVYTVYVFYAFTPFYVFTGSKRPESTLPWYRKAL